MNAAHATTKNDTGPHGFLAVRARRRKFRRYLLSRLWHYHRLWKLNYRVRDGNGCDLPDVFTGNIVSTPQGGVEIRVVVIGMLRGIVWPRKHWIRVVKHSSVSTG